MAAPPPSPHITATPARQGRWGRHVAWVLVVSVLLAVIALAIIWAWRAGDFSRAQGRVTPNKGDAAAFHAPAPKPPVSGLIAP